MTQIKNVQESRSSKVSWQKEWRGSLTGALLMKEMC